MRFLETSMRSWIDRILILIVAYFRIYFDRIWLCLTIIHKAIRGLFLRTCIRDGLFCIHCVGIPGFRPRLCLSLDDGCIIKTLIRLRSGVSFGITLIILVYWCLVLSSRSIHLVLRTVCWLFLIFRSILLLITII